VREDQKAQPLRKWENTAPDAAGSTHSPLHGLLKARATMEPGAVVHPSYMGGSRSKTSPDKNTRPYLKKITKAKRAGVWIKL
jgi:hypothetical protein